jgi:restriction endonuclease S subunit
MNRKWPTIQIGEVLIEQKQRIGTFDANCLPLLGVSNQGGIHRSTMPRISDMSRYLRVERDWFAYNPMRINVGSIGWAQTKEQTGVISPDYVVFSCSDRILPRLLFSFLKHRQGLREINNATAGSVLERLYFNKLVQIRFSLPPIAEQHKLVERVGELAAQINEACTLRHQAAEEAEVLFAQHL